MVEQSQAFDIEAAVKALDERVVASDEYKRQIQNDKGKFLLHDPSLGYLPSVLLPAYTSVGLEGAIEAYDFTNAWMQRQKDLFGWDHVATVAAATADFLADKGHKAEAKVYYTAAILYQGKELDVDITRDAQVIPEMKSLIDKWTAL